MNQSVLGLYYEEFEEGAADDDCPEQAEDGPSQCAAHNTYTNRRVGGGYHHVDADVVEQSQVALALAWHPPVVERAERKHNQHAYGEERDTKGELPT